jgi:uncharacterized Zn finger protein (UPF0148 family)
MSTAANIGVYAGLAFAGHRVPPGCVVLHPKFCEKCGANMFVENGTRYCRCCEANFSTEDEGLFGVLFADALDKAWAELQRKYRRREAPAP